MAESCVALISDDTKTLVLNQMHGGLVGQCMQVITCGLYEDSAWTRWAGR